MLLSAYRPIHISTRLQFYLSISAVRILALRQDLTPSILKRARQSPPLSKSTPAQQVHCQRTFSLTKTKVRASPTRPPHMAHTRHFGALTDPKYFPFAASRLTLLITPIPTHRKQAFQPRPLGNQSLPSRLQSPTSGSLADHGV